LNLRRQLLGARQILPFVEGENKPGLFKLGKKTISEPYFKLLAIVDELARYRDGILDRICGVAALFDHLNHLSHRL
jgi:hypothetical protein